jgi:hypothetical protein
MSPRALRFCAGADTHTYTHTHAQVSLEKTELLEKLVSTKSQLSEAKSQLATLNKTADTAVRHNTRMRELCTCPITHEVCHYTRDAACLCVIVVTCAVCIGVCINNMREKLF